MIQSEGKSDSWNIRDDDICNKIWWKIKKRERIGIQFRESADSAQVVEKLLIDGRVHDKLFDAEFDWMHDEGNSTNFYSASHNLNIICVLSKIILNILLTGKSLGNKISRSSAPHGASICIKE